jgi:hypothetical protein
VKNHYCVKLDLIANSRVENSRKTFPSSIRNFNPKKNCKANKSETISSRNVRTVGILHRSN